ncbi:MAG: hypothetical protein M3Y84_06280, partial [Acidobacteriota bacterium]|nr:hypothetical protein [Acidobacteriota bacterium]
MSKKDQDARADQSENGEGVGVDPEATGQSATPIPENDEPRVVYRRAKAPDTETQASRLSLGGLIGGPGRIAPAIMPLIVGFLLLLILIFMLGLLSVRRMDEVSVAVLDLEQQHAAKLSLLLKLRFAVTKLNNEARTRAEAEARG